MNYQFNDGGREAAGFKGTTGDCVCRSIAIASGKPYQEVYDYLARMNSEQRRSKHAKKARPKSASHGINTTRKWFKQYMESLGFKWMPTMFIGQGCKVHLKAEELPMGKLVVALSGHLTAMIDGVIQDIYNPDRDGTRCVYGYYQKD